MLIKFYSDVGGFTMFGDAAVKLIKMTGHTGQIPSAILPEDLSDSIAALEAALAGAGTQGKQDGEVEGEIAVSLRQRAFPLIELLKKAAKNDCEVLWDKA